MNLEDYVTSEIRTALRRDLRDRRAPVNITIGRIDTLEVRKYREILGVDWQANLYSPDMPGIKPNATGWISLDFLNFKVFMLPEERP